MTVVSSRYARALIDALSSPNTAGPDAGLEQLNQVEAILRREPGARRLLVNPAIPPDRRDRFIDDMSRALGLDTRVGKLLRLLVERRRLEILEDLIEAYRKMLDERNGVVRARVTSATPLSPVQQHEVADKLEMALGKRVVLDVGEDPALIGGLVVRIGSTIYDGSVLQHLATFKQQRLVS